MRALSREQPSNGAQAVPSRSSHSQPGPSTAGALQQHDQHNAARAVSPIQSQQTHYRAPQMDRATPIVAKRWSPSQQAAISAAEQEAAAAAQRLHETAAAAQSALSPDTSKLRDSSPQIRTKESPVKQKSARVKLGEPAKGFRAMRYVLRWSFAQKLLHSLARHVQLSANWDGWCNICDCCSNSQNR